MDSVINIKDMANDELKGRITDEDKKYLESYPDEWLDALICIRSDIDWQESKNKVELENFRQECFKMGHRGKSRFFEGKKEYESWLDKSSYVKARINERILKLRKIVREKGFGLVVDRLIDLCERASDYMDEESWHDDFKKTIDMLSNT